MQSAAHGRVYQLLAGHPALDLVNTLDWRFRENGPEELLSSYGDLLRFTAQSGLLTPRLALRLVRDSDDAAMARVLVAARDLREAAARVFYAAVEEQQQDVTSIQLLEHYFRRAHEPRRLFWIGTRLAWQWPESAAPPELPLWQLALSVEALMTSDQTARLRECGNPDCHWLFLDTSKNRTRRWCDMKLCGNRMKARRFKAQRRAAPTRLH